MVLKVKNIRKWRLLLLFVVIAAALWYINKLGFRYKTEITIPVRITVDHTSPGWVENPDFKITCNVEAKGGDIVRQKLNFERFTEITLSSFALTKQPDGRYKIAVNSFKDALSAAQNRFNIVQLIDTLPALRVIPLTTAVLPISSRIIVDCRKQFMVVGGIEITPAQISVKLPTTMLDTLKYIQTEKLHLTDVNKSLSSNIELVCPAGAILSEQAVRYSFDVAGYTEIEYRIMVESQNMPPNWTAVIVPAHVNVIVRVPLSTFRSYKTANPIAIIDYNDIRENKSVFFRVKIDSLPHLGQITRVAPEFVEPFFVKN